MEKAMRSTNRLTVDRSDKSLRTQTVVALRQAIIDFRFEPGERLTENRLCKLTGVSRTTIREALRHLETEGMVTIEPHVGPRVTTVTPNQVREIFEVRTVLEALAISLFIKNSPDDGILDLIKALECLPAALAQQDGQRHVKALDHFYNIMYRSCGNDVVAKLSDSMRARVRYIRAISSPHYDDTWAQGSAANYTRIIEAVKRRDSAGAKAALQAQLNHAARVAVRVVSKAT